MSIALTAETPKSLVTGGAGFIGSHVVDNLIRMGHQVVVLDDLSGGFKSNVNLKAEFLQGSVTDDRLIDSLYAERRFDYVFHLAAYAAEGLSHFIRRFNYTNNLLGSMTLLNAALRYGCKCYVFTSSIAVYGAGQTPMDESTKPEPEDPYGIAKYAVEMDLQAARRMFGLNYIVFRPHNVYGERQNIGDKYRNVIGIFMNQVMQGTSCTILGDGLQTRAFSHVDDVAPTIAQSVLNPEAYGEVFNVGADTAYTVLELAEMVQRTMGKCTGIRFLDPRKEVMHAHSSHCKAKRVFGGAPAVSLEEGLTRMARWAWTVGPRVPEKFRGIEVERGLPAGWM
jgi:UDP-glucose 4-epimerase